MVEEYPLRFCYTTSTCEDDHCDFDDFIEDEINCPLDTTVADLIKYDDIFIRTKILIVTAAVCTNTPQDCFNNQMPTMKVIRTYSTDCNTEEPPTPCFGYLARDDDQKVLAISFRGTQGSLQFATEILSFFEKRKPFFDVGNVLAFFLDGFNAIWRAGMGDDLEDELTSHQYDLWVTGHSLGGALASVAASHIVRTGLINASRLKLVTMGQPRTGDKEFAMWHDTAIPYSYRIVHDRDMVTHMPPQLGKTGLYHHRTEVWYTNNMTLDADFHICRQAEGPSCSGSLLSNISYDDHGLYFVAEMPAWGALGCPTNWL